MRRGLAVGGLEHPGQPLRERDLPRLRGRAGGPRLAGELRLHVLAQGRGVDAHRREQPRDEALRLVEERRAAGARRRPRCGRARSPGPGRRRAPPGTSGSGGSGPSLTPLRSVGGRLLGGASSHRFGAPANAQGGLEVGDPVEEVAHESEGGVVERQGGVQPLQPRDGRYLRRAEPQRPVERDARPGSGPAPRTAARSSGCRPQRRANSSSSSRADVGLRTSG